MKSKSEQWRLFCLPRLWVGWSLKEFNTFLIAACLTALCMSVPVAAQRSAASLSGTVTDQSSAVIPKAHVTVTETATGVSTSAQANEQGYFVVSNLNAGSYKLHVEKAGFEGYERTGIVLQVGEPATISPSRATLLETVTPVPMLRARAPPVSHTKGSPLFQKFFIGTDTSVAAAAGPARRRC